MKCKNCNNELAPHMKFCPVCGTPSEQEFTETIIETPEMGIVMETQTVQETVPPPIGDVEVPVVKKKKPKTDADGEIKPKKKKKPVAEGEEGVEKPKKKKKKPVAEGEEGVERPKKKKKKPMVSGDVEAGSTSATIVAQAPVAARASMEGPLPAPSQNLPSSESAPFRPLETEYPRGNALTPPKKKNNYILIFLLGGVVLLGLLIWIFSGSGEKKNRYDANYSTGIATENEDDDFYYPDSEFKLGNPLPYQGSIDQFSVLSEEYIYPYELNNYTSDELRILRNAIYAMHGYEFKSADLQQYFGNFYDYYPYTSSPPNFNKIEQKNISTIKSYE